MFGPSIGRVPSRGRLTLGVVGAGETLPDQVFADVVPFRDTYQAGIVTPAQNHLYFSALDLTSTSHAAVQRMLAKWTQAAERMTAGLDTAENGAIPLNPEAPPADTGEALELPARDR